ncbi:MAG: histidine phosphatase family protein [Aestuariivirga sp.]
MTKLFPKIYFIRHGETDWNKQRLVQSTADNDLNATGVAQAEAIAKALHDLEPELRNFDFYSSPQIRAQHTMQIICAAQPRDFTTVKTDARLRELEFGIWEGRPIDELHHSPGYPIGQVEHYNWKPEGGESYAEGVARVDAFVRDMKGPSLIVSHGAMARCFIGYICDMPRIDITRLPTPQGCYCVLENGKYQWFDAGHNPV